MSGATLFRRNGPSWRFGWSQPLQVYVLRTSRGTHYAIFAPCDGKGIWIGRYVGGGWVTCEAQIGAEYIQFDNGGEYWFRRPSE